MRTRRKMASSKYQAGNAMMRPRVRLPMTMVQMYSLARSILPMPMDWVMAAVAPLEIDMITTIMNIMHWVTIPMAACASGPICPAAQMLVKPVKKNRYIIRSCGQVRRQIAPGLNFRLAPPVSVLIELDEAGLQIFGIVSAADEPRFSIFRD